MKKITKLQNLLKKVRNETFVISILKALVDSPSKLKSQIPGKKTIMYELRCDKRYWKNYRKEWKNRRCDKNFI